LSRSIIIAHADYSKKNHQASGVITSDAPEIVKFLYACLVLFHSLLDNALCLLSSL
jgi:hypothetical protein